MGRSRQFAKLAKDVNTIGDLQASGISPDVELGGGVTVYDSVGLLPYVGNEAGDQVFVNSNNRLYIWEGAGWYNVALINRAPSILSVTDSDGNTTPYTLSNEGAVTTITINATDSDGDPITFSVTKGGGFDSMATLSQDSSVFTITPFSQDSVGANGTSGTLTFKVTDGVNISSSINTFTLSYGTPIASYDVTPTNYNDGTTDWKVWDFQSTSINAWEGETFTNTLTITEDVTADVFLIGGGGQGNGGNSGGGGGAGGAIYYQNMTLSAGTYSITIGDGGQGSVGVQNNATAGDGTDGTNTTAFGLTAFYGGLGGQRDPMNAPIAGGSGGGAAGYGGSNPYTAGAASTQTAQGGTAFGNAGGTATQQYGGSGGGGAGGAGGSLDGGVGIQEGVDFDMDGSGNFFGGGGGGAPYTRAASQGGSGVGGGSPPGTGGASAGGHGTAHTGSGGGGAYFGDGGDGGSGRVIFRIRARDVNLVDSA